jgi:peptidoglycan/LPS O-acetylase OafA/YrhL
VSRTENERRVVRLDGVRAIAALSVACFHVWLYRSERPRGERTELLDQALFHTSTGLVCFFVLSGYLLYGPFARAALRRAPNVAVGPYVRRRAARIVPAYWACGAGCLVLYEAVGYHAIAPSAGELPAFALFLQNYSPSTMGDLNPVMWTLGVEVAFYAVLPLVGWLALRLSERGLRAQALLVVAVIAVSPAWNVLVLALGWEDVARRALPAWLGCFGVGMLVAVWAQQRSPAAIGPRASAALVVAAVAIVVGDAAWSENGWWLDGGVLSESFAGPSVQLALVGHLATAGGFALLIAAAAHGSGSSVAWLAWRPLAAVGVISYGVYLWHLPLLLALREGGLLPGALLPRLLVVVAVTLPVAAVSWRWIERPVLERSRRRPSRRRRLPARTAPAAESAG